MNKDVQGEKCVRDDNGHLTLNDEAKLLAWKTHFPGMPIYWKI